MPNSYREKIGRFSIYTILTKCIIFVRIVLFRKPFTGKFGVGKGKTVGFETRVDGVLKVFRVDYDPVKGPHINVEVGKGKTRKKLAVEFPGTEADVDTIIKRLQR